MARRHRSACNAFLLFNPNTTLGWSVARRISFDRGEAMISAGAAIQVLDEFGKHIGYKLRDSSESRNPVVKVSGNTSLAITARESKANAGLMGRSRTAHMDRDDPRRLSRIHPLTGKLLAPEDAIERAREKVRRYPLIGGMPVKVMQPA